MAKTALPCPTVLRQLLRYEPETGKLFWKSRSRAWFKDGKQSAAHNCAAWNGCFEGAEAFTTTMANGYKQGCVLRCSLLAHRVAFAIMTGAWPTHQVDHVNGVRDDNRWANLRAATNADNGKNQKRRATNSSGHNGVSWFKRDSRWVAMITANGKQKNLGYFDDINDAIAARKAAEAEHGFHKNHGRAA